MRVDATLPIRYFCVTGFKLGRNAPVIKMTVVGEEWTFRRRMPTGCNGATEPSYRLFAIDGSLRVGRHHEHFVIIRYKKPQWCDSCTPSRTRKAAGAS